MWSSCLPIMVTAVVKKQKKTENRSKKGVGDRQAPDLIS